jgi:hypothetical protein
MLPYINAYALRVPLVYQFRELGGQEQFTKLEYNDPDRANIPDFWINKTQFSVITTHPDCNAKYPLNY